MCEYTYLELVHAAELVLSYGLYERMNGTYLASLTALNIAIRDAKDDLLPSVCGDSHGVKSMHGRDVELVHCEGHECADCNCPSKYLVIEPDKTVDGHYNKCWFWCGYCDIGG